MELERGTGGKVWKDREGICEIRRYYSAVPCPGDG